MLTQEKSEYTSLEFISPEVFAIAKIMTVGFYSNRGCDAKQLRLDICFLFFVCFIGHKMF